MLVTSIAPKSVVPRTVELEPVLLPVTESVSGGVPTAPDDIPPATVAIPPATADATAGGGTTIKGLKPGLPLKGADQGVPVTHEASMRFGLVMLSPKDRQGSSKRLTFHEHGDTNNV